MLEALRGGVLTIAFCAAAFFPASARAEPILMLSNGDETAALTLDDLLALPQHDVITATEFTDGPVTFTGPLARDVLEQLKLNEENTVRLTAMNDYFLDVPTSDFKRFDVIMALEADGTRLSRRDKGPIWLIYPIDDHEELSGPIYNARLIWQLVRVGTP